MADGLGALSREREYVVLEPIQTTGNRIEASHQGKLSDRNRRHDFARKRILGSPHFPCQFANSNLCLLGGAARSQQSLKERSHLRRGRNKIRMLRDKQV